MNSRSKQSYKKSFYLTLKLVGAFSRRTLMFLPAVDEMTFKDGFGKPEIKRQRSALNGFILHN